MSKKPTTYQKNNPNLRPPKIQHIRHIKPEFYVHEGVNNMSVNARYAEPGTWTCCDKHGRFEWKPRMLKRLVMPYDDVDFESLMNEWLEQGFVQKYEVNGEVYGQFFNWEKHQGINLREKQSAFEYPAPPKGARTIPARADTNSVHADTCLHVQTRVPSEGKGKGECKGQGKCDGEEAPFITTTLQPSIQNTSADNEQEEPNGQKELSEDVKHLMGVTWSLINKTPRPSDVERLLRKYPLSDIENALREYVGNLEERELPFAEHAFFADSGCEAIIAALRDRRKQ